MDIGSDVGLELGGELPGHLGEDRARRAPNVLGASLRFLPEARGKASVVLYPHRHPTLMLAAPGPPHVPGLVPPPAPGSYASELRANSCYSLIRPTRSDVDEKVFNES
jgi:hypothetical protein